jgi:hypothetical protein
MIFKPNFVTQKFKKISIDAFLDLFKQENSEINIQDLKRNLTEFKILKSNGEKCSCGNPIWAIGSAISGKGCFTCITGESNSAEDYEIE